MNWSNWPTYANQVLSWFLGLFPQVLDLFMSTPVIGIPIILGIVVLILRLVLMFAGAFMPGNSSKSEK